MRSKEIAREKLLLYLSDPDNGFLSRAELSTDVLGYKNPKHIYNLFTGAELDEIESQALDERRKAYASRLAAIDLALLKKAASGDTSAAKLAYQRFEGWMEKAERKANGKISLGEEIQKIWESLQGPGKKNDE